MTREEAIKRLKLTDACDSELCEALEMAIKALEQEPCNDAISREAVIDTIYCECSCENLDIDFAKVLLLQRAIKALPSVTPQPEVGRWIYDKNIDNWKCSKCGETPRTMGYCGSAAFMAKHFKYCNHCGVKMGEVEE